jgi:hypothetical protein
MVSYPTPSSIKFNTFKGIRTRNGIAQGGVISATECKNIDFAPSSFDAGINLRTSYGNVATVELSGNYAEGYTIIRGFEFDTEQGKLQLIYAESNTQGVLLKSNMTVIKNNLTVTGQANGITMLDNAYNTFVFTNGVDYIAYCPDGNTTLQTLTPEYDGNAVTGLAICEQDGSIVIGCNEGVVLASRKGDITDFDYVTPTDTNKAWYQLFGKPVTAVVPYIDALLVFTEEDSTVLSGNMSDANSAKRADASLGGCMSYESWCKHDKYLFFYDNRQRNIYYYMQNDYGQKVLGEPIAPEVQKFFNGITRLQMISYVGNNRSEIWILSNNFKLIYDYFVHEWSERDCQELTSYFVYDNEVYSTSATKILHEKAGNMGMFDGVYYPSTYKMQLINLGSFSNMKEMEFQPLLSVTGDYNNTFVLDCQINGKKTKSKNIKMYFNGAIWADDTPQDENTPDNELWDAQFYPDEDESIVHQVKGKFISNWYFLVFTIRTEEQGDDFSLTCFELKGITEEADTVGVK